MTGPLREAAHPPARRLLALGATFLLLAGCTSGSSRDANDPRSEAMPAGAATGSGQAGCRDVDDALKRVVRGWVPGRAPDLVPIPRRPTYIGGSVNPVHTGPWDYLAHVPLVAYGPGIVPATGEVAHPATMADVAPSIASLVGYDFDTPDGDPLAVLSEGKGSRPRLVVTVVWDGGGWNALREHEGSWPFLERAMARGVSYTRFDIGSSPTNTPPVHTTLGTGRFPRSHGIPGVKIRTSENQYADPYEGHNASKVRVPSLADVYDEASGNRPEIGVVATVNWHLGMIGHGAAFPGGDPDLSVLLNDEGYLFGDPATYRFPPQPPISWLAEETERLDRADGAADDRWNDDDLTDLAVRYSTPAYIRFQQRVLERTISDEGFGADAVPDLLFTNFKQIDDAGHQWGLTSDQVGANVRASDHALRRLTRFLDAEVGPGEWAVLVTADHGQMPYSEDSGNWPVSPGQLTGDIDRAFDDNDNGVDLVWRTTAGGVFIDRAEARALGVSLEEIAEMLIGYRARENAAPGEPLPAPWRDDPDQPLFNAVVAGGRVAASRCPGAEG